MDALGKGGVPILMGTKARAGVLIMGGVRGLMDAPGRVGGPAQNGVNRGKALEKASLVWGLGRCTQGRWVPEVSRIPARSLDKAAIPAVRGVATLVKALGPAMGQSLAAPPVKVLVRVPVPAAGTAPGAVVRLVRAAAAIPAAGMEYCRKCP